MRRAKETELSELEQTLVDEKSIRPVFEPLYQAYQIIGKAERNQAIKDIN